jgi:hypothetical protein
MLTPAAPAISAEIPMVSRETKFTSTPNAAATSGRSATARVARPHFVFRT